jgi:hypothetical protein
MDVGNGRGMGTTTLLGWKTSPPVATLGQTTEQFGLPIASGGPADA